MVSSIIVLVLVTLDSSLSSENDSSLKLKMMNPIR